MNYNKPLNPRDYPEAKLLRQTEPYHFERKRHRLGEFPRPSQANVNQPNQRVKMPDFRQSTADYWRGIYEQYLKGRT